MKSVIVIGGGGHARVLVDTLLKNKIKIVGFVDPVQTQMSVGGRSVPYLGADEVLQNEKWKKEVGLVNGIGSIRDTSKRREIYERFKKMGYSFTNVIHPSAVLAQGTELGEGVQIMAGVVIQTGTVIGKNTIINTCASVDHDCKIGDHVHLAPRVTLSGGVCVEPNTHVGTGAESIQGQIIKGFVSAGSTVGKGMPQ